MAERPIECSQCTRPIAVRYTEVTQEGSTQTENCNQCPILQMKIHGRAATGTTNGFSGTDVGVCCGRCGTTLLAVRTGSPLGCPECYVVFEDILVSEIITQGYISLRLRKMIEGNKKQTLHAGKTPEQIVDLASTSRIVSLHEALKEALKGENYEQAAWLRDQIKALTENPPHEG
jgi:protein arginine kinase activator